jgi:hypothetical protein
MAGNGLFAKKAFKVGDTVTISPVLALPSADVELLGHDSVLQVSV